MVNGASIWGPVKWKELEDVMQSIPCTPCRKKGLSHLSAIHDLENWSQEKKIFNRENFLAFADLVDQARIDIALDVEAELELTQPTVNRTTCSHGVQYERPAIVSHM